VQKNYPYFALGEYQYECDRNNKLLDRKGEHNFIFDPSDLCVLVHGRDKSPSGKSVGKPFSLVFHKEP
jgi:hypothetical protein